jgi:hypothetical protein
MDALLRGHARRDESRAGEGTARDFLRDARSGAESDAHLDADELSAFAERALPDAARARYAAHLADCDDCRRVATQVALAAHVAVARDEGEHVSDKTLGTTWRERVAAMFAPRAWRYAMPVVALLCVGVVALILMKRVPQRNAESEVLDAKKSGAATEVSQDENHVAAVAEKTEPSAAATTRSDTANNVASNNSTANVARNAPPASDDLKRDQVGGAVASANTAGAGAPTTITEQPRVEQQPAPPPPSSVAPVMLATPTPPPPEATPSSNADEVKVAREAPKDKSIDLASERAETKQARKESARGAASGGASSEQRASNRTALRPETITATPGAKPESNAAGKKTRQREAPARDEEEKSSDAALAKSSGETRNAGGRKFRREGNAWIDTAYNSSQATTNVRRNSEQYRALVADEPEVGRIADALGGEVIVVWKGRAYRIR